MKKPDKWELLMSTPDEAEAYEVRTLLEGEGIACRLDHTRAFPGPEHGGKPVEVNLYVPPEDFEAASAILAELDLEEEE